MTDITPEQPTETDVAPEQPPEEVVRLRAQPPQVVRLSRKAVAAASAAGLALIAGALLYALWPQPRVGSRELFNIDGAATPETITAAPKDYSQVPVLGPPLPGDLGKPILDARRRGAGDDATTSGPDAQSESPARAEARALRQRARQEREAARSSRIFVGSGVAPPATSRLDQIDPPAPAPGGSTGPAPAPAPDPRQAFLERADERGTASEQRLSPALGANVLQAGTVIPAALITGIRSDLPGQLTGQVTQNVYDSVTGRNLLIAQGSRLIGQYDADVGFGQSRVLLVWTRLILTDGRSIALDRLPGADAQGFAGLQDRTDYHWGGVFRAALVSTLLGVGTELGSGSDASLVRALRRGSQDSIARAGDQVVSRELNVRPTLTIRPGAPLRVMVTRDIVFDLGKDTQ